MPGEQLPPIVARLEGEDAEFLDMLARDVAAVRVAAGEIEAQLAGLDIGAGLASSLAGGDLAAIDTNELARDLGEQMSGVGAALAEDLGTELGQGLAEAGIEGGHALADGVTEGASALGDRIAVDVGGRLVEPLRNAGRESADAFGRSFEDEIPQAFLPNVFGDGLTGLMGQQGGEAGREFTANFNHAVQDEITRSTLVSLLDLDGPVADEITTGAGDTGREAGRKLGDEAGKAAGDGMSPLIVSAIVGAAAVGAPALVAGMDTAFTAITAKALENNAVIKADYADIATVADAALQKAVTPLAPDLHAAVGQLEGEITTLQPQLDGLFSNAGPDITQFASGIGNLASGLLPGLSTALGNSHDLVADVSASMGTLGAGVGDFLTGLTRDSSTTGQGLEAVIGTASQALGTLGNIAGSASSAISADLLAVTPAVNVALQAINELSSPATVGAAGGAFAVFKLGGPIEKGLDSVSNKFLDMAADTVNAGGALGKVSGIAEGASTGFSKMASIMGGPWGIAIGAGVGLLSGLAGELINAGDATKAVTVDSQKLLDAVAQDGGAAGQATAAYITATDAANGLSDSASQAGVSQAEWTEAVLGNADAQKQVTDAISQLNQTQRDQGVIAAENARDTGKYSDEQQMAAVAAAKNAAANNTFTDSNQKVINSLHAQTQEVADAIAKQTAYQQAMDAVTNTEALFNASLTAAHNQLVANAQASALSTVGALNLGNANYSVTSSLDALVTGYSEAKGEGDAYAQVLQALNGETQSVLGSEAAFTTALSGVTAAAKANGTSLDVNTEKGAANITAFTGIATAADKAADSVYNSEVSTKGATQAYEDANTKLAAEKLAFEQAAEKAGYHKQQVQALADELFKLPPDVKVYVDTTGAEKGLETLIQKIDGSSGTVKIYENTSGDVFNPSSGGRPARASGGPVQAGVTYTVNEAGVERFTPATDGFITAHSALGSDHGGGGTTVVHNHYYVEGSLIHQDELGDASRRSTLQFQQRNSYTGLSYD